MAAKPARTGLRFDPTGYLPPLATYVCTYVKNWVAIKTRWQLAVDPAEKQTLQRVISTRCSDPYVTRPNEPNVATLTDSSTSGNYATGANSLGSTVTSAPTSSAVPSSTDQQATDPRYATCGALLSHANHAPYKRGVDPEYVWYTDRDRDGLVCE